MDAGELVALVNEELDGYGETRDVNRLRERVKRLRELISEMHRHGFRTPSLSLRKLLPSMEELEDEYTHVKFADMEFDNPDAHVIRNAPECAGFMGLPFTVYYKNGKIVKATSSIQSMEEVRAILDEHFKQ